MKKRNIDFGLLKKTCILAIPIMIQNGIANAVGLVDNLMVGSQGTEAIVAVSIAGQLMFVFWLALFGALSGPGIFGAQYYGNGDLDGVRDVFRIKLWMGIFVGLLGILIFFNFDTFLLGLYMKGQTEDGIDPVLTMNLAKQYLRIMLLGIPFIVLTQVYATSLRETDESFKPMISGIVSVLTDVVFNYLLIFGNFGFPALGVAGAAYATVIARVAEFLVLIVWSHLRRKKHPFLIGIYKSLLIKNRHMIKPILIKSVPIMLNEFLWAGAIAFMTTCYSQRGLDVLAGINISNAICNPYCIGEVVPDTLRYHGDFQRDGDGVYYHHGDFLPTAGISKLPLLYASFRRQDSNNIYLRFNLLLDRLRNMCIYTFALHQHAYLWNLYCSSVSGFHKSHRRIRYDQERNLDFQPCKTGCIEIQDLTDIG